VWIGVAALALTAGAVAGLYIQSRSRTDVPTSTLGNYRF